MPDDRESLDKETRDKLAAALRGKDEPSSLPWWVPQTPADVAMVASGLIPGRVGRLALAGTTAGAVMSPRDASGEGFSLRDLTRVRK